MATLSLDDIKRNISHYVNGVSETGAGNVLIAGDITPAVNAEIREKITKDINAMPPEWVLYFATKRPKLVFADRATVVREHGAGDTGVLGFYNPLPMQFLGHVITEPAVYSSLAFYSGPDAHKNKQDRQKLTYDSHVFWHEVGHYVDDAAAPGVARYWSDSFKEVTLKDGHKIGLWDAMTKIYQVQVREARAKGQDAFMALPKHVRLAGNYAQFRHSTGSNGGRELYALVTQDWMQSYRDMNGDQEAIYAKMQETWGKDIMALFHASRTEFAKEVKASTEALAEKVQAYVEREVEAAKASGAPLQAEQMNGLFDRAMKSYMQTGLMPDELEKQRAERDIETLRTTYKQTFEAFAIKHGFADKTALENCYGFCGDETASELSTADVKRFGDNANAIELAIHQLRSAPNLFAKKLAYQNGAVREEDILKVVSEEYARLKVLTGDEKQVVALMKEQYPYLIPSFQPQIEAAAAKVDSASLFIGKTGVIHFYKGMEKYQRRRWELEGKDPANFQFDRQKELDILLEAYRSQGRVNMHFVAEDRAAMLYTLNDFIEKAKANGEDVKAALARFDTLYNEHGIGAVKMASVQMSREIWSSGHENVTILESFMASVQSALTEEQVKAYKLAIQATGGVQYDLKEYPKIFWNDLDIDQSRSVGAGDIAQIMFLRAFNKGHAEAIKLADANGDGKIEKYELEALDTSIRRAARMDYRKEPHERVIDLDGNDKISNEELAKFATKLGLSLETDVTLSGVESPILQQYGAQLVQFAKEVETQNNLKAAQ
ncbi:MAG: hypothetical protein MRY32_09995 [Rickettsiales bacterium]|nr:hypothetical protein [Rickettsiales bacterium]